jgi:hypothetical protein
MNDQDKALVDQLRAWQPLVSNGHEVPGAGNSMYEAANRIESQAAEIERLRNWSLKALTVVEWVCGEGWIMSYPHYDADDLLCDGAELLDVYTSVHARILLGDAE